MRQVDQSSRIVTRLMFRLLPIQILLALIGSVNAIVSSLFAGNFIGPRAMAAVGLYGPVAMLLGALSTMMAGGSQILCGKYMGRNLVEKMQNVFSLDMAVSTGGNVEGSDPTKEVVTDNGVIILPGDELQRQVPWDASKMLSGNISAFLTHFYNKETKEFEVKLSDEIMKGCLLTQGGAIIHERFKEA